MGLHGEHRTVVTVTYPMALEEECEPAGKTGNFLPWQVIETEN